MESAGSCDPLEVELEGWDEEEDLGPLPEPLPESGGPKKPEARSGVPTADRTRRGKNLLLDMGISGRVDLNRTPRTFRLTHLVKQCQMVCFYLGSSWLVRGTYRESGFRKDCNSSSNVLLKTEVWLLEFPEDGIDKLLVRAGGGGVGDDLAVE